MSRAAISVFVWGVYMMLAGMGFLFKPPVVLPLYGFETSAEQWVHVFGLLVAIVGLYYFYCARWDVVPFIQLTIVGRLLFMAGSIGLVLSDIASPSLLIMGGIDTVGAIWTWLALRDSIAVKRAIA